MKKEITSKILSQTKHGYDLISKKFSQTRKHFWRGLEFISDFVKDEDKILDYGCGNGRLMELFKDKKIEYLGVDVSEKLLFFARKKYSEKNFLKINPKKTKTSFKENQFNVIYSIAVFHHFPSEKYRKEIAEEFFRITKSNGTVIITVWNLLQKKYRKNIFKNWKLKIQGKSKLDWMDCEISFIDNQGKKFNRFHHAFTKRELKKLFSKAGFKVEKCDIINERNIILIGKKI